MASKLTIATCSLAGCFGCHMSLLDIDERLLDLLDVVEFDRSPINDIKTIEGINDNFLSSVKQMGHVLSSASRLRTRDLLRDVGLSSLSKKLDFTEYGGACLLGVNGNVIIAHGRSQAKAIKNAIGLARETVERGITEKLREGNHG